MRKIQWVFIATSLFLVIFLLLSWKKPSVSPTLMPSPSPWQMSPKVFELIIKDRKIASGPSELKVLEGDQVLIKVTSNSADKFHLRGYDTRLELAPGETSVLKFMADIAGRFGLELENSKIDLGTLEVEPR